MKRSLGAFAAVLLAFSLVCAATPARAQGMDYEPIFRSIIPDKDLKKLTIGESTLATVSDPGPLLRFGAKGVKAGDQVKLTKKPNGKWLIEPAPPKGQPVKKRPK